MRSRRSSRPSWSSNALTLAAAGSLSRTPVVPAVLLSRVVLSCTDMLCPPGSGYPLRTFPQRTNTAVAEPVPLYGDGVGFRVVRARSTDGARRLRAREAPPARPPRPRRDDHRCLGRAERTADQGILQGSPDAEAEPGPGAAHRSPAAASDHPQGGLQAHALPAGAPAHRCAPGCGARRRLLPAGP